MSPKAVMEIRIANAKSQYEKNKEEIEKKQVRDKHFQKQIRASYILESYKRLQEWEASRIPQVQEKPKVIVDPTKISYSTLQRPASEPEIKVDKTPETYTEFQQQLAIKRQKQKKIDEDKKQAERKKANQLKAKSIISKLETQIINNTLFAKSEFEKKPEIPHFGNFDRDTKDGKFLKKSKKNKKGLPPKQLSLEDLIKIEKSYDSIAGLFRCPKYETIPKNRRWTHLDEILNPEKEKMLVEKLDNKYLPPASVVEEPKKLPESNKNQKSKQFHKFGLKKYKIKTKIFQQQPVIEEVEDFKEISKKLKPASVPLITQKRPTKRYLSPIDLKRIKIKNKKKLKMQAEKDQMNQLKQSNIIIDTINFENTPQNETNSEKQTEN